MYAVLAWATHKHTGVEDVHCPVSIKAQRVQPFLRQSIHNPINVKVMNPTRCKFTNICPLSELTSRIDKIPVPGNGQQSLSSDSFQYDSPTKFQNTAKPEAGTDQRYELEGTNSRCAKFRLKSNVPSGGFMLDDTEIMSISAPCGIPDDIFVFQYKREPGATQETLAEKVPEVRYLEVGDKSPIGNQNGTQVGTLHPIEVSRH